MCDAGAINTYFMGLGPVEQTEFLKELADNLNPNRKVTRAQTLKKVCNREAVKRHFRSLSFDDQKELLTNLIGRIKNVTNANVNDPTNADIQAAFNALNQAGGKSRRRNRKTRRRRGGK